MRTILLYFGIVVLYTISIKVRSILSVQSIKRLCRHWYLSVFTVVEPLVTNRKRSYYNLRGNITSLMCHPSLVRCVFNDKKWCC